MCCGRPVRIRRGFLKHWIGGCKGVYVVWESVRIRMGSLKGWKDSWKSGRVCMWCQRPFGLGRDLWRVR